PRSPILFPYATLFRSYDLVVTLDDATSAVYSGFLVAEEGTASSFRALSEVLDRHGLFCELYTDRGSHYFHTPKAGEAVSKSVQRSEEHTSELQSPYDI